MYSDAGTNDRWGGGDRRPQRYSREVGELDYIVPRGGACWEHDDRDVWKPSRGRLQSQDAGAYNLSSRNADMGITPHARAAPHGNGHRSHYRGHDGYDERSHHPSDSQPPISSRLGDRPRRPRSASRERSPRRGGRSDEGRKRDREPDQAPPPRRPRSTIHSQVHQDDAEQEERLGAAAAAAERQRRDRGRPEESRRPAEEGAGHGERGGRDAAERRGRRAEAAAEPTRQSRLPSQVVVSRSLPAAPGRDRAREEDGDRWGARREALGGGDVAEAGHAPGIAGSARFAGRLGAHAQHIEEPHSRPRGGMRSDASKKWGHDLFESINAEPDTRPPILQRISLF